MELLADKQLPGLLSWMGAKQTLAPKIIEQLGPHNYYFECFAGSMAVLMAKAPSSSEIVCDLHGALTNLAWVLQDEEKAAELYGRLARTLNADTIHRASVKWFREFEGAADPFDANVDWAYHFFVMSQQGRNGTAGTARCNYQHTVRYTNVGGNAASRFSTRVETIPDWHHRLRGIQVLRKSVFDILPKLNDETGIAIYADPPYLASTISKPLYLHDFAPQDHQRLAKELGRFRRARVVVSYYDDPQLDTLYPGWTKIACAIDKKMHTQNKRGSKREEAPEVLLVNGPAFGSDADSPLFSEVT